MENHIKCDIKDIQEFKWCLDSVKFPTGPKKFNVSSHFTAGKYSISAFFRMWCFQP